MFISLNQGYDITIKRRIKFSKESTIDEDAKQNVIFQFRKGFRRVDVSEHVHHLLFLRVGTILYAFNSPRNIIPGVTYF